MSDGNMDLLEVYVKFT